MTLNMLPIRSFIVCALLLSHAAHAQSFSSAHWWPPAQHQAQQSFETALNGVPAPGSLRAYHDLLGSEPHIAGTPGDQRTIERMVHAFQELGLDVQTHEFWAYLSQPIQAELEIVSPAAVKLSLKEAASAEDCCAGHADLMFGFNAYSGSGKVTSQVVYANQGTKADFEK